MPVTNNAVTAVPSPNGAVLFSFMGLEQGKPHADTTLAAFRLDPGADAWQQIDEVPGKEGRLVGIAATPWPGEPVFGHAGGIVGDTMVIADGVGIEVGLTARRFSASRDAYKGIIDPDDPTGIEWRVLEPHPGRPLYRMAASGTSRGGERILFAGGSDNPYNAIRRTERGAGH